MLYWVSFWSSLSILGMCSSKADGFIPCGKIDNSCKGPWLPFSDFSDGSYDNIKNAFRNTVTSDLNGKSLEKTAEHSMKHLVLASEHRTEQQIRPSGIWTQDMGTAVGKTWRDLYSILLDGLFIDLAKPQPRSPHYIRLLAARDALFEAWISRPRESSKTTTLFISSLSNLLAILDIRFLSLRRGQKNKWGAKLARGLPPDMERHDPTSCEPLA